jgi:hypothetical protein
MQAVTRDRCRRRTDFARPRKVLEATRRLAEISTVDPAELRRLRDLYVNPPEDDEDL